MNTRWTMLCAGAIALASPIVSASEAASPEEAAPPGNDAFAEDDGWAFVYANTGAGGFSSGDKAKLLSAARQGRPIGASWLSWHGEVSGLCADTIATLDGSLECHMEIWCDGAFEDAPDPHAHVTILTSRGELHSLILGLRGGEERLWALGEGASPVRWFVQSPEPIAGKNTPAKESFDSSLHLAAREASTVHADTER